MSTDFGGLELLHLPLVGDHKKRIQAKNEANVSGGNKKKNNNSKSS